MLLILKPFTFILLTIREEIGTLTLTLTLDILAGMHIPIGEGGGPLTIRFAFEQFPLIFSTIRKRIVPNFNLLTSK